MLRGIFVTAAVLALPFTSAIAHADDSRDESLVAALDQRSVPFVNVDDVVDQAYAVCTYLSTTAHGGYLGAMYGLAKMNPEWSDRQRNYFIGAAVDTYCVHQRSALPRT